MRLIDIFTSPDFNETGIKIRKSTWMSNEWIMFSDNNSAWIDESDSPYNIDPTDFGSDNWCFFKDPDQEMVTFEEAYNSDRFFRHRETNKRISFHRNTSGGLKVDIFQDGEFWKSEIWHFWVGDELVVKDWIIL